MAGVVHLLSGVRDPMQWGVRTLLRAQQVGMHLWVWAEARLLEELQRQVHGQQAQAFVPLAAADASTAVRRRSRLQCHRSDLALPTPGADVHLLQLASEPPEALAGFAAIYDAVGLQPQDLAHGRERFKRYRAAGLRIEHREASA